MKNLVEIIIFCLIPIYSSYLVNEISKVSFQALKFKRSDRFEPIPFNNIEENNNSLKSLITIPTFVALLSPIKEAFATEGAYGIFEGRTASMLHPLTMLALFATSMYRYSFNKTIVLNKYPSLIASSQWLSRTSVA
jgi:hypothetical protein